MTEGSWSHLLTQAPARAHQPPLSRRAGREGAGGARRCREHMGVPPLERSREWGSAEARRAEHGRALDTGIERPVGDRAINYVALRSLTSRRSRSIARL
ncbi:hypothetical protein CLM62_36740 [Streptomyces sp. SA15]|nr:hypothetical protein CLM62_36740 [Streptomyces sp. SA15]